MKPTPRDKRILQELIVIFAQPDKKSRKYRFVGQILIFFSFFLIFVSSVLASHDIIPPICIWLLSTVGGLSLGLGYMFIASAIHLPVWTRYTTLNSVAIKEALDTKSAEQGAAANP
jgi:lipid-A-disaccharide synthase-like uncharacterized protein